MRYLHLIWAVPSIFAIGVLWLVSAWANYQSGVAWGSDAFGYVSVSFDVMKAALPFAAAALAIASFRLVGGLAASMWAACVAWSLISAIGFVSLNYNSMTDQRGKTLEDRQALTAQISRLEDRRSKVETVRPESVVSSEITALLRTPGAGDCSVINGPVTQRICPQVDALQRELGHAKSASWLDGRLDELRGELKHMEMITSVDARNDIASSLIGIPASKFTMGLAVFFAIALEAITAIGIWVISRAFSAMFWKPAESLQKAAESRPVSVAIHAPRRPAGLPDVIEKAQAKPQLEAPVEPEPETPPDGDGTPAETTPDVTVPEPTTVVNFPIQTPPKQLSKREKAKQKKQRVEQENRALVESFVVDRLDTDVPRAQIELTSKGGHSGGGTSGDDIYQEFRRYCRSRGVPGVGKSHLGRFIGEFVDRARNHKGVVYGAVIRAEQKRKVA